MLGLKASVAVVSFPVHPIPPHTQFVFLVAFRSPLARIGKKRLSHLSCNFQVLTYGSLGYLYYFEMLFISRYFRKTTTHLVQ